MGLPEYLVDESIVQFCVEDAPDFVVLVGDLNRSVHHPLPQVGR